MLSTIAISTMLFFAQSDESMRRFNKAMELQRQGAFEEAAAEYKSLLIITPTYVEAQANYGAVLARLGKYDEAIAAYEAALKLNPKLVVIQLNIGIAHYRAGHFDKAIVALTQFSNVMPNNRQAKTLTGLSLVELGKDQEALAYLEPLLSDTEPDVTVLYTLGTIYLKLNRNELLNVIELLNKNINGTGLGKLLLAQHLLEKSNFEGAAKELEEAQQLSTLLPQIHFFLGLSYMKLGKLDEAVNLLSEESKSSPDDFQTIYYLAYTQNRLGNLSDAKKNAETAVKLNTSSIEAKTLYGSILMKLDSPTEALPILEEVVKHKPKDSELRYLLARCYQKLQRNKDAAREFAEVERLKKS